MSNKPLSTDWIPNDSITLRDGVLRAPNIPDVPGLYCLLFEDDSVYIGEASNLERRIGDYMRYYKGTGIESEFRINKALREFSGANVFIMKGNEFASKSQRCLREHSEIAAEKNNQRTVRNGGTLEDRILFLKAEIIRLEEKLAATELKEGLRP